MLKLLQEELPKLWTNELYSKQFNESPSTYKDFDHALKHVIKAAVALQNMVEEADHGGMMFVIPDVEKYLADLVISTVRAALKAPHGPVDLEKVIPRRILDKMGKKLEIVIACQECGAVSQCNHHDSMGRCQCTGEFGPCCRCS